MDIPTPEPQTSNRKGKQINCDMNIILELQGMPSRSGLALRKHARVHRAPALLHTGREITAFSAAGRPHGAD